MEAELSSLRSELKIRGGSEKIDNLKQMNELNKRENNNSVKKIFFFFL